MVHWGLLIVLYLFLAGMAGGILFTTTMYEVFYNDTSSKIKKGYFYAFIILIISVVFLIFDLERPERFLNMIFAYKFFSPMSVGSWALLFFGIVSFSLMAINSQGVFSGIGNIILKFIPYKAILLIGAALSVFLSAYTGVLLSETTISIWSATPFLGALFLTSGVSCGVCFLMFLNKEDHIFLSKGKILDNLCLLLEMAIILFFVLSLTIGYVSYNEIKHILSGFYGFLFIGVGIILGIVIPLFMNAFAKKSLISPALVLVGGFFLRYAIVFAGQIR